MKQGSAANDDENLKEQIALEKQLVSKNTRNPDNTQTLHEKQSLGKALEYRNSEIFIDNTYSNILKMRLVLNETKYLEEPFKESYAQDMAQALKVIGDKEIIINDMFAFTVAIDIVNDYDPQTIDEYRLKYDWLKWK